MERVYKQDKKNMDAVSDFLKEHDLKLDQELEETYVLRNQDKIVATGSINQKVLKCIAVEKNDDHLINTVMTHLVNRAYDLGRTELFIYTKPDVYHSFEYFGFKKIASTEHVVLMENSISGIESYKDKLKQGKKEGVIGAVVVNCNPFTLGHKYLIEYALGHCDHLHIFVVSEDASTFPTEVRYQLIKAGTQEFNHITLHRGGDYIISNATFPSYFLKDDVVLTMEQTKLDLNLFGEHIAKTLNITKRFIGEEPYNLTTRTYNETMKQELDQYGIEAVEIKRKAIGETISASKVRDYIAKENYAAIKPLVPESTYNYICSDSCQPIRDKIINSNTQSKLV